ncbi:NigD-like C-terminal domain-containing protein [uncultured Bacteroides sp.]|uniref:NigD1/NigD2 family lipoprotein n=1 Tax=uncultured Bacteroides sp. TaxID=162156 RepID=UPI00260CBD8C|nr:NigD-like C-terminal domain-containing protein [uncultured Bacteroides sp.]
MKIVNFLSCSIGLLLCGAVFSSCLDDDNDWETFYPTLATVNSDSDPLSLVSDSYGTLIPKNPGYIKTMNADSTGQRVLAGVQFLEEDAENKRENSKQVQIVNLTKILTKKANDLRVEGTEDVFGNDPIQIVAATISNYHLNIQYTLWGSNSNIAHRISLVLDENSIVDEEGLLRVEFRHNAEGDRQEQPFWGMVSYTLESIPEYNSSEVKGVRIVYNSGANLKAEQILKKGEKNDAIARTAQTYTLCNNR